MEQAAARAFLGRPIPAGRSGQQRGQIQAEFGEFLAHAQVSRGALGGLVDEWRGSGDVQGGPRGAR